MNRYRNYILDFNHIYEDMGKRDDIVRLDCSAISETRLYCSADAQKELAGIIRKNGISGIHFFDSGDYHYLSKLTTDCIREPFILILIDHHTDMQADDLGQLLSCGNWARKVLFQNAMLRKIVLVGQEQGTLDALDLAGGRKVMGISYEEVKRGDAAKRLAALPQEVPVYLSVDKDVLSNRYALTNWDQGEMTMYMLENLIRHITGRFDVIGVDICGEFPDEYDMPQFIHAERVNERGDEELLGYLERCFEGNKKPAHSARI